VLVCVIGRGAYGSFECGTPSILSYPHSYRYTQRLFLFVVGDQSAPLPIKRKFLPQGNTLLQMFGPTLFEACSQGLRYATQLVATAATSSTAPTPISASAATAPRRETDGWEDPTPSPSSRKSISKKEKKDDADLQCACAAFTALCRIFGTRCETEFDRLYLSTFYGLVQKVFVCSLSVSAFSNDMVIFCQI
jgi:hypothetical protein